MESKNRRRNNRSLGSSIQLANVLGSGANKIKKKIRDIERLLQRKRDTLPDTVLIEKERALEALQFELKNAETRQKIKKNAKKYHMVRFFERKKAIRRYTQALKQAQAHPDEASYKDALQERAIDVCYVVNFPKTEKYIALYPSENDVESRDENVKRGIIKTSERRKAFRIAVTKQLQDGTLPVSLEEILGGKKLRKEGTGIMLDTKVVSNEKKQQSAFDEDTPANDEEDDFFE
ncbi:LAFE_0E14202g1_1 [Lachancea fermentati]|uniref:rRNA-processing protein EFG1 n=1 Tax=Lachancea fermentati TaxID=4955 RepID=A0A1G4MEB0_LACFM|nr:LAFE_0E14202g1_1 [Lachancea fermentati]